MKGYSVEKRDHDGRTIRNKNTRVFGIIAAILCLIGFFMTKFKESKPIESTLDKSDTSYVISMVSDPNGPESGTVFYRKYKTNPALLHIINKTGADTCIRCADGLLNRAVLQFYLRAQEETTIEVPVGYFELHFAFGKSWVNQEELFGEKTMFFSFLSKYGQEFGRKKTCEFVIESDLENLKPLKIDQF